MSAPEGEPPRPHSVSFRDDVDEPWSLAEVRELLVRLRSCDALSLYIYAFVSSSSNPRCRRRCAALACAQQGHRDEGPEAPPPSPCEPRLHVLTRSRSDDDAAAADEDARSGSGSSSSGSGSGSDDDSLGADEDAASVGGSRSGESRSGGGVGGAVGGDTTDAETGEDADRLGFFGGDTLLLPPPSSARRSSLEAVRLSVEREREGSGAHGAEGTPTYGHAHAHAHAHATPRSSHDAPPAHHAGTPFFASPGSHHGGDGDGEDGGGEARALPFEFRVLDAALDAVCTRLENDVADVEAAATPALDALALRVSKRNVEAVKKVRGALTRLQGRVQTVRAELQRLLDDDSDMRDMYLTRKAAARGAALRLWLGLRGGAGGPAGAAGGSPAAHAAPTTPHHHHHSAIEHAFGDAGDDADIQELEDLLETYFAQIDHSFNRLDVLKEFIQDTEDYVNIDLDSKRNKILEFNVLVGLAALVHSFASCAYGVFGMNFLLDADGEPRGTLIPDPFGRPHAGFVTVTVLVAALCVLAWLALVWGFRRYGMIHIVTLPGANAHHNKQ
jgi:hypothetical protein